MNAPIALFVFRRPEHTRRTLEHLRRNGEAAASPLHVFSDGPRNEGERPAVEEVRRIVRAAEEGFASFEIHEAESNRGLAASVIAGVSEMVRRYGRVIVLEDDMECAPYFLRFMNEGLERLRDDERIASIHGYTTPMPETVPECFLRPGADCWGWATWERGWKLFNPDAAALLAELKRRKLIRKFDLQGGFPFSRMLADQAAGKVDSWAIRWQASVFLAGKYMLQSGRPLVRNIGGDGSGTHDAGGEAIPLWERPVTVVGNPPPEPKAARRAFRESMRQWKIPLRKRVAGKISRILRCFFRG